MHIHPSNSQVKLDFNPNSILLHRDTYTCHFRDTNVTAVDIDPAMLSVATDYFGLTQDNRLKVVIDDGVEFLKKAVKMGQSYKAVLFDVDSKDPSVGMSCPPVQFLSQEVLDAVKACIRDNGVLHRYSPRK